MDTNNKKLKYNLQIAMDRKPNVLFLGNGVLQLSGGGDWNKLLEAIRGTPTKGINTDGIPMAMLPECLCGTTVEEVQGRTAKAIKTCTTHPFLRKLVNLDFDAILTTNYAYEIEEILSGKDWTNGRARKDAFFAMDGRKGAHYNTCVCNLVTRKNGKKIPVFHVHGEIARQGSLILGYYTYANSISKLIEVNKTRADLYQIHQESKMPLQCLSWLDYFILGNVYMVGFGLDTSEFDIWWAIERKSREKAAHGELFAYMIDDGKKNLNPQGTLLSAMKGKMITISKTGAEYLPAYQKMYDDIKEKMDN